MTKISNAVVVGCFAATIVTHLLLFLNGNSSKEGRCGDVVVQSDPSRTPLQQQPSAAPTLCKCNCPSCEGLRESTATSASQHAKASSAKVLSTPSSTPATSTKGFNTTVTNLQFTKWYRDMRVFAVIANTGGTDKANMHQYHPLYAKALAPFREDLDNQLSSNKEEVEQRFSMMEIGLGCTMGGKWGPAGGYHVFRQFLPNVKYHSFEYDFKLCQKRWGKIKDDAKKEELRPHIAYLTAHVNKGDQGNLKDLNRAIDRFGKMDIVVDDGSHRAEHQKISFRHLFLNMVKPGGVYIIEDLNSNFAWKYREYFGVSKEQHQKRQTMVHYIHDLITAMSFQFWNKNDYIFDSPFHLDEEVMVWVEDITCVHEACAVYKKLKPFNRFESQLTFW